MAMPKLGPSLMAEVPPLVKFGAKFLDKGVGLTRPWVRTQEYAPVLSGLAAFVMMYTNTYTSLAEGMWHSSLGILGDEIFTQFHKLISGDNPGHGGNPSNQTLKSENAQLRSQVAQLTGGTPVTNAGARAGARSTLEF